MDDEEIQAEAKRLLSENGEDAVFRSTRIAMEAAACRGDSEAMEQASRVLLAMCDMMGREESTVH